MLRSFLFSLFQIGCLEYCLSVSFLYSRKRHIYFTDRVTCSDYKIWDVPEFQPAPVDFLIMKEADSFHPAVFQLSADLKCFLVADETEHDTFAVYCADAVCLSH